MRELPKEEFKPEVLVIGISLLLFATIELHLLLGRYLLIIFFYGRKTPVRQREGRKRDTPIMVVSRSLEDFPSASTPKPSLNL